MAELKIAGALLRIKFCFNDLIILFLFKPVPQKPDDHRKDEDAKKDYHPSELIGEKIGRFFKDSIFSKDVLPICWGNGGVRSNIEEWTHRDVLERVWTDIEPVESSKEYIKLLREVEVDEDDKG